MNIIEKWFKNRRSVFVIEVDATLSAEKYDRLKLMIDENWQHGERPLLLEGGAKLRRV
jgi:hypothetical protein